jgi:DNA gyrase/topoisomerase IV subunit B
MRRRPGLYIAGTNPRGLRTILDGVVTDLLAAPGARPERVRCTLGDDGTCCVELRGGVMPAVEPEAFVADHVEINPADPLLSLAIASGFSDPLHAEVVRDGRRWSRTFAAGTAAGPLEVVATTASPLVRIRYRPDAKLFDANLRAGFLPVCGRTRDLAAFHPHVRFTIDNEQDGQRRDFHYPGGLLSLAQELEYTWWNWFDTAPRAWRCRLSEGTEAAEAVFIRRPCGPLVIHSFVNGYRTEPDGTHIDGLRAGVAEVAATFSADDPTNPFWFVPQRRDPLAELTVLLSVRLDRPQWRGSTRDVLDGDRPHELVRRMVTEQLPGEIKQPADA